MTRENIEFAIHLFDSPAGHVVLLTLGVVLGLVLTLTGHSEGKLVLTGAGSALLLRLKS